MATEKIDTRPKRAFVQEAEWRISVELVRDDVVLEASSKPLRMADSALNNDPHGCGYGVVLFVDDIAQRRARREQIQRKARKK